MIAFSNMPCSEKFKLLACTQKLEEREMKKRIESYVKESLFQI